MPFIDERDIFQWPRILEMKLSYQVHEDPPDRECFHGPCVAGFVRNHFYRAISRARGIRKGPPCVPMVRDTGIAHSSRHIAVASRRIMAESHSL